MPFTSPQKTQIRHVLGYPQVYRDANPRLESAIEVVGQDPDATALVLSILDKIANVQAVLDEDGLDVAGLKSLDKGDVELYPGGSSGNSGVASGITAIGRQYVNELSGLFGVPIATNIFGTAGYQGDDWKLNNRRVKLAGLG